MPSESGATVDPATKAGGVPPAGALAVAAVALVCLAAVLPYLGGSGGWGVDGSLRLDRLTADQRGRVCAGMLADMGGENRTVSCSVGGAAATTVSLTTPTRAQCLEDPLFATACTVSALESCTKGAGACGNGGDCAALEACSALPPGNEVVTLTKDNYDTTVVKTNLPVLVFSTAPVWCMPCRQVAWFFGPGSLVDAYADRLKVAVLYIDQEPGISSRLGIRSIPTFTILRNGAKVSERIGAMPSSAFTSWLDATVPAPTPTPEPSATPAPTPT